MRSPSLVALLLCAWTGLDCSNPSKAKAPDGSASPDGQPVGAAGAFIIDMIRAECQMAVRCGFMPDASTCERSVLSGGGAQAALDIDEAVASGRASFHSEKTAACLAAYSALACSRTAYGQAAPAVPCSLVFQGTLASGATCFSDTECVSGECNLVPCLATGSCCMSECTDALVPQPIGAACDWACVAEAYCDRSSVPAICRPLVAVGGTCRSADDCMPGLTCAGDVEPLTCMAYVPDGQACRSGGPLCDNPQSYCDPATGKCVPLGKPGDACSQTSSCVPFATCVAGTCQSRPNEGDVCAADAGSSGRCLAGDCVNGRCTVPPAPVVPCAHTFDGGT